MRPHRRAGRATLLLVAALLFATGCSRRPATPSGAIDDDVVAAALAAVKRKCERTRSFRCAGTILAEYGTQRHFIRFRALFSRSAGLRFDLEESGPLGIGSGSLTWIDRGDSLEILLPGDERPLVRPAAMGVDDLIDMHGLLTRDAAYLVAPYAGDPALYETGRLVAAAVEKRTGKLRFVLRRSRTLREVILVEPISFSLVERRVVRPDGTVLLKTTYRYGGIPGALDAAEVDGAIPPDVGSVRIRFREKEWNGDLDDSLFSSRRRPR